MPALTLTLLPEAFAVCRLRSDDAPPPWADDAASFVSVTRTPAELSIVCREALVPHDVPAARGWRMLRVEGPLPLDLVGILVAVASPLADAGVSIFPIATFLTDWVLVPGAQLAGALPALRSAGHIVHDG